MREFTEVVAQIIEGRRAETKINPSWVANEAVQKWDPAGISPSCVRHGCLQHTKQVARQLLRAAFDPREPDNPQHELFTGLQWRYPAAPDGGEPTYVLRAAMRQEDVAHNVQNFRLASEALAKHADALESWWEERRRGAA